MKMVMSLLGVEAMKMNIYRLSQFGDTSAICHDDKNAKQVSYDARKAIRRPPVNQDTI